MKKLLCMILVTIIIVCSVPFTALADTIAEDKENNTIEDEYIYYSDLFYGYSTYLTQNVYLTGLESKTTNVTTNILNEYITTNHFKASAVFEGIGIATDPTSVAKYVSDNIGLSNFNFNDELDKANQKFVEELCNVNLNASKEVGAENKYIKNINKFLGTVEKIDKIAIEDEAYYKDLGKPKLYDYFIDRAIAVLQEYCTELEPKLPSLKSELYTTLSETTEVLGNLTDAINFTKALALSITMQETQMELIQDIINTQSSSSTLYKGMTRLKNQLSNGFVTYFTSTYIADKVYDKIIGYLPKLTSNAILGGWKSYGAAVAAVVSLVNSVVFKGWLGYDYSEYTSAVMLTQYASDLYNSIRNKANVFSNQFDNSEIQKFETLYNAYITMKASAFKECKNIAKHNSIYELKYMEGVSDYFDTENAYKKYICGVKEYISSIPINNRNLVDLGNWTVDSNICVKNGSDAIEDGIIYAVNNQSNICLILKNETLLTIYTNVKINGLIASKDNRIHFNENDLYLETDTLSFNNIATLSISNGNVIVNTDVRLKGSDWYDYYNSLYLIGGNLQVKGNLLINALGTVKIDNGSNCDVEKDITIKPGSSSALTYEPAILDVYTGSIHCKGNLNALAGVSGYGSLGPPEGSLYMNNAESMVYIDGNLNIDGGSVKFNCGKMFAKGNIFCDRIRAVAWKEAILILNGSETQSLDTFPIYNVEVSNASGIILQSDLYIYGTLNFNGNPIDQNGYSIRLSTNSQIYGNNHFDSIYIDSSFSLTSDLYCERLVMSNYAMATLTIAEKTKLVVSKNLEIKYYNTVKNYGELEIMGDLLLRDDNSQGYADTKFYNYNLTSVFGDIVCGSYSYIYMENERSILSVKGDINLVSDRYSKATSGTTILLGDEKQSITNYNCPTFIIENESEAGVVFETKISPSILFNHNGNKFTLKSGGTFVDYDGDGLKDDVDPEPTIGNPCTLYFNSENQEKGNVSTEKIETYGGTKITVTATPTFKYKFSKWIDSAGKTVSTSAKYSIVAKCNETYTAIFTKRQRFIATRTTGGTIQAPSWAEIESRVSVTITENNGYVYTEGSLKYNNIQIENGSFIMPDETVILTAEFVKNENYFALDEVLSEAKSYEYESYSKESFANLTNAINVAEAALTNNITAEESEKQITLLQTAINALKEKYISSISFKTTPLLYINVPNMINNISVLVTYDNSTAITVAGSDCVIEGFDATVIGTQTIIITYGGFAEEATVVVRKRILGECTVSEIADQLYDGIAKEYTPHPEICYVRTRENLTENTDFIVEYSDNTTVGKATVTIRGIGNYIGSKVITFKIYCDHNYEEIDRTESSCNRIGQITEQCSICKKSHKYKNVATENLPESEHNYSNNCDVSYYYTDEGANSLVLLFSSNTVTENTYDKIYIYDKSEKLLGTYTGNSLAGKSVTVSGDTVRIRLTSDSSVVKYGFSLDSITSYFDHLLIPMTDHTYNQWSTITEATPSSIGYKHSFCAKCGHEEIETIPAVTSLLFKGASISLQHNISINYKVDKALFYEVGYANPYVVFELGDRTVKADKYTLSDDGKSYVFAFDNISPDQMNDTILATLYAEFNGVEYASEVKEYSVAQYCYNLLSKYSGDENAKLRTLLVDLLNYGSASQLYTNHNTESLANIELTEEQKGFATANEPTRTTVKNTAYKTIENPAVTWKGAGLNLQKSVTMRFKIAADSVDGLSVKVESESGGKWTIPTESFIKTDGGYYIYFNRFNAGQMREPIYLTVYRGDTAVSNTIRYSVESYVYSKQGSVDTALNNLLGAMMKYGNSAKLYAY